MEWKCLHVEERARSEEMSLLDWKMCRSSSLARSVMCILVVWIGFWMCIFLFVPCLFCFLLLCNRLFVPYIG